MSKMAYFSVVHAVQGKIESTRPLVIVKLVILGHHRPFDTGVKMMVKITIFTKKRQKGLFFDIYGCLAGPCAEV